MSINKPSRKPIKQVGNKRMGGKQVGSRQPGRKPGRGNTRLAALAGVFALACLGVGAVLLLAGPPTPTAPASNQARIGGPFALEDGSGRVVTDRDFRGRFMLIYFGYSFCPDVCPTTLNDVATALDRLGPRADQVQPLFITIDPRRDTTQVVHDYAAAFSPRLIGLTGSADAIATAAREYRVYYAEHRTGPGPEDYSMDHSSVLYLMGPDGGFVAVIRADLPPDAIAAAISSHLS